MIDERKKDQDVDYKVVEQIESAEEEKNLLRYKIAFYVAFVFLFLFIIISLIQFRQTNNLTLEVETLQATISALEGK